MDSEQSSTNQGFGQVNHFGSGQNEGTVDNTGFVSSVLNTDGGVENSATEATTGITMRVEDGSTVDVVSNNNNNANEDQTNDTDLQTILASTDVDVLRGEIRKLHAELKSTQLTNEHVLHSLEEKYLNARNSYSTTLTQTKEAKEKIILYEKQTIPSLEKAHEETKAELTTVQTTCRDLQSTVKSLQNQNSLLQSEADSRSVTIERFKEDIDSLQTQLKSKTKEFSEIQQKAQNDQSEFSLRTIALTRSKADRELALEQQKWAENELSKWQTEHSIEIEKLTKENITLRTRVAQLETEISLLSRKESGYKSSLVKLQSTLEERIATNIELKTTQADLNASYTQELASQKKLVRLMQKETEELKAELSMKVQILSTIRKAAEETDASYREALQNVEAECEDRMSKLKDSFQVKLNEFREKIQNMEYKHAEDRKQWQLDHTITKANENDDVVESKTMETAAPTGSATTTTTTMSAGNKENKNQTNFRKGKVTKIAKQLLALSESASAASVLKQSGLDNVTELYIKFVEIESNLQKEKLEKQRLEDYMGKIVAELEAKAPILTSQRQDY
eukprot:g4109.t1